MINIHYFTNPLILRRGRGGGGGGGGDKASPRAEHNVMYRIIVHVQSAISLNLD